MEAGNHHHPQESSGSTNLLDQSLSSTSSLDKKALKKLKRASVLRSLFLAWKAYTQQVVRDKQLFFKIREFIIKRLQTKGFKSLKVHYIMQSLIRHIKLKREQRRVKECFEGWKEQQEQDSKVRFWMTRLVIKLEKRIGFETIKEYAIVKKAKSHQRARALIFWSKCLKKKALRSLQINVRLRQEKRETLLKLYLFTDKRLKRSVFALLSDNILQSRYYRRLNMRALRYFCRTYQSRAFRAIRDNILLRQSKRSKSLLVMRFRLHSEQLQLSNLLRSWHAVVLEQKNRGQYLTEVLTKVLMKRSAFNQLQSYSSRSQEIERQMGLRRGLRWLKEGVEKIKETKRFKKGLMEEYNQKIKRKVMEGWKEERKMKKENIDKMGEVIRKVTIRKVFQELLRNLKKQNSLVKLQEIVNKANMRLGLNRLKLISKLKLFADPNFLKKVRFRLAFATWKELSEDDRRTQKMSMRANKHHCRFLRRSAFTAWLTLIHPPLTLMPSRAIQLKRLLLFALRENLRRVLVKLHMLEKAHEQWRSKVMQKVFMAYQRWVNRKVEDKRKIEGFRRKQKRNRSIKEQVVKRWKVYTYRERVAIYLQNLYNNNLLQKYLQKIKDAFMQNRIQLLKTQKSETHYLRTLYLKSFSSLYDYKQSRFVKHCHLHQAIHHHSVALFNKSLSALYQYRTNRLLKSEAYTAAQFEHLKTKLQQVLIKLVGVGIYWSQIKGRFGQRSRVQIAMKYGMRWRAKTLIKRFAAAQQRDITRMKGLQQVGQQVTERVKKALIIQPKAIELPPRIINKSSISFQPIATSQSSLQLSLQKPQQNNLLKFIESELLAFKQKKLLLKELEDQLIQMNATNQSLPVSQLLQAKIQTLKQEILSLQPKIKDLIAEISSLKQQGNKNHLLMSPVSMLSSHSQQQYQQQWTSGHLQ